MAKGKNINKYSKTPLNNMMLNYYVYVFSVSEFIIAHLTSFILGGMTGLVFYSGLFKHEGYATTATNISNGIFFCITGAIGIWFLIPLYKTSALAKRKKRIKLQFRDMLESLASSFSAGSNVLGAFTSTLADLKIQYDENDIIIKEMQNIIDGANQGIGIDAMLKSFAERSQDDDIQNFVDVFEICFRQGGNMQSVVIHTHSVISEKIAVSLEIQTKLTSNKMQHDVMSVMPIAIVLMLKITNKVFAENFTTFTGVLINTVAIAIFITAYRYGKKIINIKI